MQGPATADFIKFATTSAYIRREQIDANLRILAWHQNPTIRAHGLSVNPNMMEVHANILEPPQLVYGSGKMSSRDGSWNLRNLRFLRVRIP
jgi:eukaryotic translation initiation factor 2C